MDVMIVYKQLMKFMENLDKIKALLNSEEEDARELGIKIAKENFTMEDLNKLNYAPMNIYLDIAFDVEDRFENNPKFEFKEDECSGKPEK